ncbi:MAG: protein kinase [Myxococcales bacterium]|nr:protein kinase [Myxococcales bacterium]MCB9524467.1 protein kinase [Myxococcales bacterium]
MSVTSHMPCQQCGAPVRIHATHCSHCDAPQVGSSRPPEQWLGQTIDGKYEIVDVLGVGGMGMVFRARRVLVGDDVALKVLFPRLLRSSLQRRLFRDEGIAAARLSHPNVVTVFDADLSGDETAYIAMELLEGHTLKELLKNEAPVDPRRLVPIAIQICEGLAAAHDQRIVHRDLKPDNVFLEHRASGIPRVKLVDFGIAAMMDIDAADEQQKLLGTIRYMAPEQCRGDALDGRADLYALGVVLYEGLTRRRATGKNISAVLHGEVTPPNMVLEPSKHLPLSLENLVMRLLAKHPDDRPVDARAARDALIEIHEELTGASVPVAPTAQLPNLPAPVAAPPPAPGGGRARLWLGLVLAGLAGIGVGVLLEFLRK